MILSMIKASSTRSMIFAISPTVTHGSGLITAKAETVKEAAQKRDFPKQERAAAPSEEWSALCLRIPQQPDRKHPIIHKCDESNLNHT